MAGLTQPARWNAPGMKLSCWTVIWFSARTWEQTLLDKGEGIAHFFQPHVFWPRVVPF